MIKTIQLSSSASSNKKNNLELDFYQEKIKKRRKSRANFDNSLPFISPYGQDITNIKNVKINSIRKQSSETQQQIILMKARIHALQQMKSKMQLKKQKSLQKIQFIQTVRDRKNFQSAQKLKEKQKQFKQIQDLKQKAKQLRQGMKKQILKARQTIYKQNHSYAYFKKQVQNGFTAEIAEKQQLQHDQKVEKIQKIKQLELKHSQKLREFYSSRIKQAQRNHLAKAQKQLKQKTLKQKSLQKLKVQQYKCIEQLKVVQKQYQQVAQKINPQMQSLVKRSRISLFGAKNQRILINKESRLAFN